MQEFGSEWTQKKIEILEKYAKAYLQIMKSRRYFKLIYFDGFAGSGKVKTQKGPIEGAASKILSINQPIPFDVYYFVDLDESKASELEKYIDSTYPDKKTHVVAEDCNTKLKDLANFLSKPENKNYRVLAFIDPKGMQVLHEALSSFKKIKGVDLWILIPTGLGTGRLLTTKKSMLSKSWIEKLENHLGVTENEILKTFYEKEPQEDLFKKERDEKKIKNAYDTILKLYKKKLQEIWTYTSRAYEIRNSRNSLMFHFLLATDNKSAVKIADDIVNKI
ncbi:MAG: three-Cys-motif partner protein TcmP [Bacteroidota bacterium]